MPQLLIIAIMALALHGCGGGNDKDELRSARADLVAAQQSLADANRDLTQTRASLSAARAEAAMKQQEIDDLKARLATVEAELATKTTEAEAGQAEIARLTTERDNLREELRIATERAEMAEGQVVALQAQLALLQPSLPCERNPAVECVPPSLMLAEGLSIGTEPAQVASGGDTLNARLSDAQNVFPVISAAVRQNENAGNRTAVVSGTASVGSISSDGDGGFHVTVAAPGEPVRTISFPKETINQSGTLAYAGTIEGYDYWLGPYMGLFDGVGYGGTDEFTWFQAFGVTRGDTERTTADRIIFTFGLGTPADGLPTGTATYAGRVRGHIYDPAAASIGNADARTHLRGNLALTANLGDGTLQGVANLIHLQAPGASNEIVWGTRLLISDGQIVGSRFTATVTGVDDNPSAALATSLRGFTGGAAGGFYGPEGQEAGATFNAVRSEDNRVMVGWFGGTR